MGRSSTNNNNNYSFSAEENDPESGMMLKKTRGPIYNTFQGFASLDSFVEAKPLKHDDMSYPKEEVVVLDYGKYNGTLKEPGCHWVCNSGRTIHRVSTKMKSIQIPETKTIDKNGNPLIINGILAYQIRNSKRAALDVDNYGSYVWTQGLAAMKQIVSKYPYEAEGEVCLKTSADVIAHEMVGILQERVTVAGIEILTFTFNEVSYAPEIASGMLKKQQATATLQARTTIVKGAVEITNGVVTELQRGGLCLDENAKTQIVSNLLTVICTDSSAYAR